MLSIAARQILAARAVWLHYSRYALCATVVLGMGTTTPAADPSSPRRVIPLDGTWQADEGGMESAPKEFSHSAVVPGLIDMARPAFAEVGKKSGLRRAFWYRRTFRIDGAATAVAILKIHKAQYGTKVFLNGRMVGQHLPCFTPAILDIRPYLRWDGQSNELLVCVGANRESLPEDVPNGWDFEKYLYIPGIYDSVELILTGAPCVVNVQTVPDVPGKAVRVVAEIQAGGDPRETAVGVHVGEAASGKSVGGVNIPSLKLAAGEIKKIDVTIPLPDCHLWSPEDPFLYGLTVTTGSDALQTRFGMRSFHCDPQTRRIILNGKPYYMRGTNVTIHRFFEDADRGDLPWRRDWVRKLHQRYKSMHWNSIRYCIGFPPDFWYDIADEEGFLIQDEFPIWLGGKTDNPPDHPKAKEIARQYTEWMRNRWNHPCVVIWDAQNESYSPEIGKAIQAVRDLDLSNRPWENGYEGPPTPADCAESHPYLFVRWCRVFVKDQSFFLHELATTSPKPSLTKEQQRFPVPIIINEYCWLWLNRDGSPTCLTNDGYKGLLGADATTEQRRMLHAHYVAALTEFWRCHREAAGVLHFCGLGYSRLVDKPPPEGGATSDDFIDIKKLILEPRFEEYVGEAFNPVGLMIDAWADAYPPGPDREFPVVVINDLYENWEGAVRFRLLRDGKVIEEKAQPCEVPALGMQKLRFAINIPSQRARYQVEAALVSPRAKPVRSLRDFAVSADQNPAGPASSQ